MITVGREEIFSFSAGGGPVFSNWPSNWVRETQRWSACLHWGTDQATCTRIILLNYLCDDCIQTSLSPGVVPGVWVQHARPNIHTNIKITGFTIFKLRLGIVIYIAVICCQYVCTHSKLLCYIIIEWKCFLYHDSGGEPGTPELAKRPARNCCTILEGEQKHQWGTDISTGEFCQLP